MDTMDVAEKLQGDVDQTHKNKYVVALILVVIIVVVLIAAYVQNWMMDFLLVGMGIAAGLFVSYGMYKSFTREHGVVLAPGEQILIDSSNANAYLNIRRMGEKKVQTTHKADLYMTNLGIIAEEPSRRELMLYIPLDMIHKADIEGKGLKIDFFNHNEELSQAVLYVNRDFDAWANNLYDYLSSLAQPPQQ